MASARASVSFPAASKAFTAAEASGILGLWKDSERVLLGSMVHHSLQRGMVTVNAGAL